MAVEQIVVTVDADVASAYRSVPEAERRKLDLLVSLHLREATRSAQPLKEISREVSQKAQQRGLTPDILQGILDEQ